MRARVWLLVALSLAALLLAAAPLLAAADSAHASLHHAEAPVQARTASAMMQLKARVEASSEFLATPLTPAEKKKKLAADKLKKLKAAKAAKAKGAKGTKTAKAAKTPRKTTAAKRPAGVKPAAKKPAAKQSAAKQPKAKKTAAKATSAKQKAPAKGAKAPAKAKAPKAPRGKRNGTKLAKSPKAPKAPKGKNGTKSIKGPKLPKVPKGFNTTAAKGPNTSGTHAQDLDRRLDAMCTKYPKNRRCVKRVADQVAKLQTQAQQQWLQSLCATNPKSPDCQAHLATADASSAISTKNDESCLSDEAVKSPECKGRLEQAKATLKRLGEERKAGRGATLGKSGSTSSQSSEEALKLVQATKVLKLERIRQAASIKSAEIDTKRAAELAPLRAQLDKLTPGTPEHKAVQLKMINVEVKWGIKSQDLSSVKRKDAARVQADAVNGAKAVLERPKEVKKYTKAECAKDPKCPLHSVKDFQGKDITQQVHNAFEGGRFEQKTYERPVTLYRCTNGERDEKKGAGSWWSRTVPKDSEESRKRLAISKDWGSAPLRKCYSMTVPAGKPMVEGIAGAQKDSTAKNGVLRGGGQQTFFPDADESLMNQQEVTIDDQRETVHTMNASHANLPEITGNDVILK